MRRKRLLAVVTSIALLSSSFLNAGFTDGNELHLLSQNHLTAVAADGSVTFDEESGTLTLHGAVTKDMIDAYKENEAVTSVVAAEGTVLPSDCSKLFDGNVKLDRTIDEYYANYWLNLQSIDLSKCDTSSVTNMSDMFGCMALTKLNISGFDTSNVTDMSQMFDYCTALTSLDVSNFDTSKITDMSGMFDWCSSLTSLDVSNFDTSNVTNMRNMFGYCRQLTFLDVSNFDTSNVTDMGNMFYDCAALTALDVSNFDTSNVTDMAHMFYDCAALTALDVSNFDTSNVTYMSGMFYDCEALTSLDVSKFDTSKVTGMSEMFQYCFALTSLDLSNFDTSNVTGMSYMFFNCKALTSLDLSNFDTSNVKDMRWMFRGCEALTSLDLSNFDTSNVTNMSDMFDHCSSLTSLNLSSFDTSNVTGMSGMFAYCSALKTIYTSYSWADSSTLDMTYCYCVFTDSTKLVGGNGTVYDIVHSDGDYAWIDSEEHPGYFTYKEPSKTPQTTEITTTTTTTETTTTTTAVAADGSVTFDEESGTLTLHGAVTKDMIKAYRENEAVTSVVAAEGTVLPSDCSKLFYGNANYDSVAEKRVATYWKNLQSIDLSKCDTSNVTKMSSMFMELTELTSLDLSGWNTSNVTNMYCMFDTCSSLTSLDVSKFDTSNVTDMNYMFHNCFALTSLDVSSFDTSNVTDMSNMFDYCNTLTSLDVSSFDTSNVTNMNGMFSFCEALTSLDVSSFDTSNVTDMIYMFDYCKSLTSLDVSSFDTSNVTTMNFIFIDCLALTSLNLGNFDTSNLTEMIGLFKGCRALTSLDLSSFDTSKVTNMGGLFQDCMALTSLDLSNFDTSKVTNMNRMFDGCSELKTIYTSYSWADSDAFQNTSSLYMFRGAALLIGGNGTVYDANHIDADYAWIDSADHPGYFTYKEASKTPQTTDTTTTTTTTETTTTTTVTTTTTTETTTTTVTTTTTKDTTTATETTTTTTSTPTAKTAVLNNSSLKPLIKDTGAKIVKFVTQKPAGELTETALNDDGDVLGGFNAETSTLYIYAANGGKVTAPADCSKMFDGMTILTELDLSALDTSNVTNMNSMFHSCKALKSLDLSNFDTSNVTDMSYMFYECRALTSLDVSSFDTSNVTDMSGMFGYFNTLTSLDLSNFDTSNVTDMRKMFYYCNKLTSLDVSNFDTSNVTNMSSMFIECRALTSLDVSSFDTSNVTNMSCMFNWCASLTSLDLSNFDTSKVTDMSGMFLICTALTSLDVSSFDTSNVTTMQNMFYECRALTSLDLSSFDTSNVTRLNCMFFHCSSLETIYASYSWPDSNTFQRFLPSDMFIGAINLVGGNGTVYDAEHTDGSYARLDSADHPGYFTYKESSKTPHTTDTTTTTTETTTTTTTTTTTVTTTTTTTTTTTETTTANTDPVPPTPHKLNIDGRMIVKEMDLDEIMAAGIDLGDASNYHVFKYEVKMTFDAEPVVINKFEVKTDGTLSDGSIGLVNVDGYNILPTVTIGNKPVKLIAYNETPHEEMYLIINGECKWLKEFYDVQLLVLNKDDSGESLTNCTATLNSPEGLTLMNCESSQHFDTLEAGSSYMIHWYLRGDVAGDYNLSAVLSGWNNGEEFTYNFKALNTLHVYAGNALKMKITVPKYSFYDEDYPVKISFINVSDKPIYNIEHTIFGFTQSSKYTTARYKDNTFLGMVDHYENLQSVSLNKRCSIDVLNPGEEIVADITIHDIWKSILEQEINRRKLAADYVTFMTGLFEEPTCLTINLASTLYKSLLDSIVVGHVLGCVDTATLSGSTTTIPHEVVVTDISPELAEKYEFHPIQNLARELTGWVLDQTNLDLLTGAYNECVFLEDINGAETPEDLLSPSVQYGLSFMPDDYGFISDVYSIGEDVFWQIRTPNGGGDVAFSVESSEAPVQPAPGAQVKSLSSDFDMEVISGDYTVGENGKLIFTSNGIVKMTPKKAGVIITVCAVTENGQETRIPVQIVDEHTCEGDFFILRMPGEGRGAVRASFCNTCHKLLDCKQLPVNVVAMFSNGECYDDIRGAVADAASYGDGLKLYIFGGIDIVEDVTIPEYLTLVITPDTDIKVADGCKLVAKGKVEDYSGRNYDLSGNGPIVTPTTAELDKTTMQTFITDTGAAIVKYVDKKPEMELTETALSEDGSIIGGFDAETNTLYIYAADGGKVVAPTDCSKMFDGMTSLTEIDLSGLDTSNVTTMKNMFYGCESLTSLDVSGFDTSNVTDMSFMFGNCKNLTALDTSGFVTDKVTDMRFMFAICSKLAALDLSSFDTSNVTSMEAMFMNCKALDTLDLSNFDTSNVTNMSAMFTNCEGLQELNVTSFDTSNVTTMSTMFSICKSLSALDLSSFNIDNVTTMEMMFTLDTLSEITCTESDYNRYVKKGSLSAETKLNAVAIPEGDVDGNRIVDEDDIAKIRQYVVNEGGDLDVERADINHDGKINLKDVVALKEIVLAAK